MASIAIVHDVKLNNLLYLTDFSEPAEAALPFVTAIARDYGSKISVCHILLPNLYACMAPEFGNVVSASLEEDAQAEMKKVESQLTGLPHRTRIEWGPEIQETLQRIVEEDDIDLMVLGTHGRTGVRKFLLGSVAEEIWRWARVPVLTVGPKSRRFTTDGFRCVLICHGFQLAIIGRPAIRDIDGAGILRTPCPAARDPAIQKGRNSWRGVCVGCDLPPGPAGTGERGTDSPSGVGS